MELLNNDLNMCIIHCRIKIGHTDTDMTITPHKTIHRPCWSRVQRTKTNPILKYSEDLPRNTLHGSFSCTSMAAALIRLSFKASARAASSTNPPRAVLTRNAPGRICLIVYSLIRWWLCSFKVQCRETQSDLNKRSWKENSILVHVCLNVFRS